MGEVGEATERRCENCGQRLVGAFADGYGHFDPKAQRYICTRSCSSPWHETRQQKRAERCPLCGAHTNETDEAQPSDDRQGTTVTDATKFSRYRVVHSEGARIGVVSCLTCGATVHFEEGDDSALERHIAWHRADDPSPSAKTETP